MNAIVINADACTGDGICVDVCAKGCLVMENGRAARDSASPRECTRCGACIAACPAGAISLNGEPLPAIRGTLAIAQEQLDLLFATRRSVRSFTERPVPEDVLLRAIDRANYAPSASYRHNVHWTVITNPELLHETVRHVVDFMRGGDRYPHIAEWYDKGIDAVLWSAPCLVLTHDRRDAYMAPQDCSAALTYLELMLHGMGLGSCWAGLVIRAAENLPEVAELLGIPPEHQLVGGLMVGYPTYKYPQAPPRQDPLLDWKR